MIDGIGNYSGRRGARHLLIVATLAGSIGIAFEAEANGLSGRKLRAEAGSVLSADLHIVAERESRRRGVALPTIVSPAESEMVRTSQDVMMRDGLVTVVVTSEDPAALVPELQARGMTSIFVHQELNHLRGDIPIENLLTLEDLSGRGLLNVRAEHMPMTNRGAVTSQADWLMEADRVRDSVGGYTGAGQRIGTLSDSYNRNGGVAAGFASGDLPTVTILQEGPTGTIDEGRAMIELMYDLTPNATYAFATAFIGGESGFASNITALAANTAQGRCTVIVDDVFYFAEPMFQDGLIAQAINNAVTTRNATYFSAAGNFQDQGWEAFNPQFLSAAQAQAAGANFDFFSSFGPPDPGSPPQNDYQWLDFDPGAGTTPYQLVTLGGGGLTANVALQWDDPYYLPGSVQNDLDIYVVDSLTNALVSFSFNINMNSATPHERVVFTNNSGSARQYRFYIGRWISSPQPSVGDGPTRIKWVNYGSNGGGLLTGVQFGTSGPTITPHAAAAQAMAVGAINYWNQQGFADFTSKGPSSIFFSPNGVRLPEVEIRNKPDFSAIQGTNTTFFFAGNDIEGDGFPNFSGTSAAAPHAAAVAALVRQRNPSETPAQIYQRLRDSAETFGNPADRVGAGSISAFKAVYGDPVPVEPPYATGFEAGFLDVEWETRKTGSHRAQVTDDFEPAEGGSHLVLHGSRPIVAGRSEATLHVNLEGYTDVELSFLHRRAAGESSQTMPTSFNDGSNTDGVAYSVDGGATWKRIVSLTGSNSTTTTQPFNYNLTNIATTNGDSLNGVVLIRFQEFDNQPAPTRGHYHDEITVTASVIGDGIPGDVNDDGVVNVADVTLLKLYLNDVVGSVPSLANADFNEDGEVNDADLEALVDFIVNN